MSAYQLSDLSGVNRTTIQNYLLGRSNPGAGKLKAIADALGVHVDYFLTGEEPAEREVEKERTANDFFAAPVVGEAAAGAPVVNGWREADTVTLHRAVKEQHGPGDYVAAWVRGDSMTPRLLSGDLVVIKKEAPPPEKIDQSAIYAVNIPGEEGATLKRLRYRPGPPKTLDLVSINPDYPVESVKLRDTQIIGRVVGVTWRNI